MALFVPKGLAQAMQWKGSSSLMTRFGRSQAATSSCGFNVMTFSGQVAAHNPQWTQSDSVKRSIGRSGLSERACVGQALTQDRHSVQPSTRPSSPPKGGAAAAGSGIGAAGAG